MKIAIAKTGDNVSEHFGHCDHFDIYNISGGMLDDRKTIPCPPHEPCKLPGFLKELGVDVIIAGGMGSRAAGQLNALGIEAYFGVSGAADRALAQFVEGKLKKGESACSGGDGHDCGH